jgi:flagellar assembly protein FliH
MLCSIFDEREVEVGEVPWGQANTRGNTPPPVPVPSLQPHTAAAGEVSHLQAQLEEAQLVMEGRVKEAWENGLRTGEAAARQSQDEQIRASLEQLAKTVAEVSSTRGETIRRAEADTVRLSIEIARRVLHRELSVDPSALEALIKAAIARLQTQEIYRVRVHPDLEPLMRACLEQAGRGSAVELIGDRAMAKGGASFEINRGTLDASLDAQLREIEYGLVDEIRRRA